jgi:hypothetical protein
VPDPRRDQTGRDTLAPPGGPTPAPPRPPRVSAARPPEPTPPPRPRVTSELRPPRPDAVPPRPGSLSLAATAWTGSFILALFAFVAVYTDRQALRETLTNAALADDPTFAADVLRQGVTLTMVAVLVANLILIVLAILCLTLVMRGRGAARWFLFAIGLVSLLLIAFDQSFVTGGFEADRVTLGIEAGLVLIGTLALLSPSAGAWLRAVRR